MKLINPKTKYYKNAIYTFIWHFAHSIFPYVVVAAENTIFIPFNQGILKSAT
jgi:hypothetical protein